MEGYKLPDVAQRLLIALALYKVRRFLEEGLRLRTACDLVVKEELKATAPQDFPVPSTQTLAAQLPELIAEARAETGLLSQEVLRLTTNQKG